MMSVMRRFWPVLALAALGVGIWFLFGRGSGGASEPRWVTAAVDRGAITATVTATGTVNPVETVQVGTYVSGPIQAIYADFNSPVKKGQLLAKIDPRSFQTKVDASRAELENARAKLVKSEADLALREANLRRQRALERDGIVAESDLDIALSEYRQAKAQADLDRAAIASAAARLNEAEVNLAYTDIVAPVDGVVVSRNVNVGQTVAASFQTPVLFTVAEDLTKMLVVASVSESDIGGIAPDQEATFTVDAYPARPFHGRVAQVRNAPVAVQNVVTYDVLVGVDNADLRLKPGMTANITITTASLPDVLRVPTSALRFRPPGRRLLRRPRRRRLDARRQGLAALRAGRRRNRRRHLHRGHGWDRRRRPCAHGHRAHRRHGARRWPIVLTRRPAPRVPVIELRDLVKTYALDGPASSVQALRGITLTIEDGELLAIMGASGSGKSTLLNVIGCLDRPTSGSYRFDGREVAALDADDRAELRNAAIGFVFQSFNLLPRTTVLENVELPLLYGTVPLDQHRRRAEEALRLVGIADLAERVPQQLSGGQQQRVAIARALVTQPRVVLADEPTGNLDTATSDDIVRVLRELNARAGLTIIIVTHEEDVAAATKRVVVLRDGRLVADGPPDDVLARRERRR